MLKILKLPLSDCTQLIDAIISKLTLLDNLTEYNHFLTNLPRSICSPTVLSYINAHAFNLMQLDKAFAENLLASDKILRDGIGLSILLRLYKIKPGINMNGTDFNPKIIEQFLGKKIALCGTSHERLAITKKKLEGLGHYVVLTLDGFQADKYYLQHIQQAAPELIVLGMGMPKQERVAIFLRSQLDYPCLIINTGAAIDYISGCVPRAPGWIRVLRCEWLYRMLAEPKRLWKRYLLGNPVFLARVFLGASLGKIIKG